MQFLQGFIDPVEIISNPAATSGLGDYDMDYAAQNPQYKAKTIADYAKNRAALASSIKAAFSNPADALLYMAWSFGGQRNLLRNLTPNAKSQVSKIAFRDMLTKQGSWSADQAFSALVNQEKARNPSIKRPFGSGSQDKPYFVKCFNVSKGIFTKLKGLLGNPNAFWQEVPKAVDALSFDIYDDTKHPMYVNIRDKNLTNSLTVNHYGVLAGAIAALGSIKPTQPVVAFIQGNKSPGASAPVAVQGAKSAQQPQSGKAQKPMQDANVKAPTEKSDGGGLSTGAWIGIGVAGLVVVGGAAAFMMRSKGGSSKIKRRS